MLLKVLHFNEVKGFKEAELQIYNTTLLTRSKHNKTYEGEVVHTGSGNVFADLELPNPEERLVKARLVTRIAEVITTRELTQVQAGIMLGIDQLKVSKLVRGRLSEFSTSTLMQYLTLLGQDVEIVVQPKSQSKEKACIHVTLESAQGA
jgi:predicted XRE-type DNA-binding protein